MHEEKATKYFKEKLAVQEATSRKPNSTSIGSQPFCSPTACKAPAKDPKWRSALFDFAATHLSPLRLRFVLFAVECEFNTHLTEESRTAHRYTSAYARTYEVPPLRESVLQGEFANAFRV